MNFIGRKYLQNGGYYGAAIRFANGDKSGVCTTSYSFGMSKEERYEMARRITAALNLVSNLSTEQIENLVPIQASQIRSA